MTAIVIQAWAENNCVELETRHFSKGTSTTNFKTARNSGCRSPISQVKTDSVYSVSGKIHLLFPALEFLDGGLSF